MSSVPNPAGAGGAAEAGKRGRRRGKKTLGDFTGTLAVAPAVVPGSVVAATAAATPPTGQAVAGAAATPTGAQVRPNQRTANRKAGSQVVKGRQNLVWRASTTDGDWLIAAPFRPSPGWDVSTDRNRTRFVRLLTVPMEAPPLPDRWGGHPADLTDATGAHSFRVLVKSGRGDDQHVANALAARNPGGQQAAYTAPVAALTVRTPNVTWAAETQYGERLLLRTRAPVVAGSVLTGEIAAAVTRVFGTSKETRAESGMDEWEVRVSTSGSTPTFATAWRWITHVVTDAAGRVVENRNFRDIIPVVGGFPPLDTPVPPASQAKPTPTPTETSAPAGAPMASADIVSAAAPFFRQPLEMVPRILGYGSGAALQDWARAAVATASSLQDAQRAARAIEAAVVHLAASPQGRAGLEIAEQAFPGAQLMVTQIPAGVMQALATGAADVVRRNRKVHAFYQTCITWAANSHYLDGGWRGAPHPTWVAGRAGSHDLLAGVQAWCDHDPDRCNCCGNDVSDKTLMIGMSADISAADVARWCRRWGSVLAIVPNPVFAEFATRVEKSFRVFSVSGDPQPIRLPSDRWFGALNHAKVPGWFWQSRKELNWTRQPIGAAFMLVTFGGVTTVPPSWASGSLVAALFGAVPELDDDGFYCMGGTPVARRRVVEEATVALAGLKLSPASWETLERTVGRLVREAPGPFPLHEEVRAGAEAAWALTREVRSDWQATAWLTEVILPYPDAFTHASGGWARPITQVACLGAFALAVSGSRRFGAYGRPGGSFLEAYLAAAKNTIAGAELARDNNQLRAGMAMSWGPMLTAPFTEEACRTLFPRLVTAGLILGEPLLDYLAGFDASTVVQRRIPTTVMHLLAYRWAGTRWAVGVHFYWNFIAVTLQLQELGAKASEIRAAMAGGGS